MSTTYVTDRHRGIGRFNGYVTAPLSTCLCPSPELMNVVPEKLMTDRPCILFNKTVEQLRRLGACGGRAYARNQRARRRAAEQTAPQAVPSPETPRETTAEAIAMLDAQFPWLRGVEKRFPAPPTLRLRGDAAAPRPAPTRAL